MSALLAAGAACARPGCGHGEDLHDGICFGTACECVRFVEPTGALPMPAVPARSEREELRAAFVAALDKAHQTHPCPATGRPYWVGCVHYDEAGRVVGVGSCHSGRRADAVLAVRDAEMERLRAEVASLNESLTAAGERLRADEAQRKDLAARLRAGQTWQRDRNPALVSQDYVSQDELRAMFGIPLVAPWDEPAEVFVPQTERSRWVAIAEALNAAHDAGMPVGIDLDGTLTDHRAWSVVWDRDAERWTVAGYEDGDESECPCPPADRPHQVGCPLDGVPDAATRTFAPVASPREPEGEHYPAVHHDYLKGRDLDLSQTVAPEPSPIVAYRDPHNPRVLLCREHGKRWHGVYPVTAEDLPDGGICSFGRLSSLTCGRDVLTGERAETGGV